MDSYLIAGREKCYDPRDWTLIFVDREDELDCTYVLGPSISKLLEEVYECRLNIDTAYSEWLLCCVFLSFVRRFQVSQSVDVLWTRCDPDVSDQLVSQVVGTGRLLLMNATTHISKALIFTKDIWHVTIARGLCSKIKIPPSHVMWLTLHNHLFYTQLQKCPISPFAECQYCCLLFQPHVNPIALGARYLLITHQYLYVIICVGVMRSDPRCQTPNWFTKSLKNCTVSSCSFLKCDNFTNLLFYISIKGESRFVCGVYGCSAEWSCMEVRKMALLTQEETAYFEAAMAYNTKNNLHTKIVSVSLKLWY